MPTTRTEEEALECLDANSVVKAILKTSTFSDLKTGYFCNEAGSSTHVFADVKEIIGSQLRAQSYSQAL